MLSEYQYLIDVLGETSRHRIHSEKPPDKEMIDDAVRTVSSLTEPDYIIAPIAFYVGLHALSRSSRFPVIQYEEGQAYYNYAKRRLRILWSNKFIRLNELIIGNSRDSLWLFKSSNGAGRLTVQFYFEEPEPNPILLVQTVFRFRPPSPERMYVIKFPGKLCKLK